MSTSITTTIKITRGILEPSNQTLAEVYKPLGRCVAVVDDKVEKLFGAELNKYFEANDIPLVMLVHSGNEVDKDIDNVEQILVDLKKREVARHEPVLIVGGGVIADIGGFACALYHRNTPYVMLCTSIVSGIDAGPSPRTCCDGFGYKNLYGAYHPPVLTLTDRAFFKTLHPGWLRHGIAEIIKMACVKDAGLFALLEEAGERIIRTKFGVECADAPDGDAFGKKCDLIIAKAMEGYVRSEYGNLWETHQCRPHAFGHMWSPGYELPAGMLHGHAVATCMGLSSYMSYKEGWITEADMHRILRLCASFELSLWHPVMDDIDLVYAAQVKITDKRGGNLCAPVPRGAIGQCGYINDMPKKKLAQLMREYKAICATYPRGGLGVEVHCRDVGLDDPSTVAMRHVQAEKRAEGQQQQSQQQRATDSSTDCGSDTSDGDSELPSDSAGSGAEGTATYNEWIEEEQGKRAYAHKERLGQGSRMLLDDTPPAFDSDTLFKKKVEDYATQLTTPASSDVDRVVKATEREGMFMPCMVGQLEGQFLKMFAQTARATSVLDVGTFTGYSALCFAEGMPDHGRVVTVENDARIADVAAKCFAQSAQAGKIELKTGDAPAVLEELLATGHQFDIVFLDADKENYKTYYDFAMRGLLADGGCIMADNSLCALVYGKDDVRRQKLHEFNRMVLADDRVEQTVLTVREGVTIIRRK